ncbi:hypothetical protein CHARACLAT_031462 [Characodon lateralis]|uniref:Uncharacterized protein n=1 Tax=Characodon lateralis TaxID=208331 RepID=A0ABU7D5M4_9TELE|nr:hypothetical protein [Characodon lateralis]
MVRIMQVIKRNLHRTLNRFELRKFEGEMNPERARMLETDCSIVFVSRKRLRKDNNEERPVAEETLALWCIRPTVSSCPRKDFEEQTQLNMGPAPGSCVCA